MFNVIGKEVATLVNEVEPEGNYEVEFNGSFLTGGVYFYIFKAGKFVQAKKMILLR